MSTDTLTSTFVELKGRFTRLALKFLPSEEDAADALQDAFLKLWSKRSDISSRSEAEALSVVAIKNQCIDTLRKRHMDLVELNPERDAAVTEGTDERIEVEERFREVEQIIDSKLSEKQRIILRMKEYDDMSIDEIAAVLDMEPANVRVNLSRARKTIRECYQNRHKDESGR